MAVPASVGRYVVAHAGTPSLARSEFAERSTSMGPYADSPVNSFSPGDDTSLPTRATAAVTDNRSHPSAVNLGENVVLSGNGTSRPVEVKLGDVVVSGYKLSNAPPVLQDISALFMANATVEKSAATAHRAVGEAATPAATQLVQALTETLAKTKVFVETLKDETSHPNAQWRSRFRTDMNNMLAMFELFFPNITKDVRTKLADKQLTRTGDVLLDVKSAPAGQPGTDTTSQQSRTEEQSGTGEAGPTRGNGGRRFSSFFHERKSNVIPQDVRGGLGRGQGAGRDRGPDGGRGRGRGGGGGRGGRGNGVDRRRGRSLGLGMGRARK